MSKKKNRAVVTKNTIVDDVASKLEKDGRWSSLEAAERLQVLPKIVDRVFDEYEREVDRIEGEACRLVEKQSGLAGAATVQLPLEGMPEAHKAIVVLGEDGSKELRTLENSTPNQHKAYTKNRLERKALEYNLAKRRDLDSDRIIAQVGVENADVPFSDQFPADVFPQVGRGSVAGELSDGS